MATIFGSAVSSSGSSIRQSTRSFAHARERVTLSTYDGTPGDGDILVFALMKSSDLLEDIEFWCDGNPTAGTFNIGIYQAVMANQGISLTAIDDDLFASAQTAATAIAYDARVSVFDEAGTLDDVMDRGKTLWALAAIGAATYTEDPGTLFALCATDVQNFDAAAEVGFRVKYVAGD